MHGWWRRHGALASYVGMLAVTAVMVLFMVESWPARIFTWLVLNLPVALWMSRKGW
jgi:hypothetical protein